ncbi:putative membrane protein [Synechococcus sp. PCC 7502]|uniref:glycosyltransferase n=1 Tax=Synechococcus sp. PCC 7502 TaxID=1173263 RepID=UPI00029FBDCD|nr:glycosyltransferase [Synechococcus sp. PCC 7502]AFY73998.1 putative membrane protein [Synechococcus sp. PCC 7502]
MSSNLSSSLLIPNSSNVNGRSLYFSLVIPTFNESQNIKDLVPVLTELLDKFLPNNYELIVVDDDSPDRTWEVAEALTSDYPQLQVLRRIGERGLSTAVIRGWQNAQGQVLGVIDGDLQHPPERLIKLLDAIKSGADLAVASRHVDTGGVSNWSLVRRFLSRGAQLLGLVILPGVIGRVSDPMSGYFVVRRHSVCDRQLSPIGYKILIEVLARGDISKVTEVGYVFQERQEGTSKVTWKQYLEYISHLLRLRFSLGEFRRFLQFGLVGFSGVFVDMAVLYLLHDPSSLGWGLTRSKFMAGEVAIINNFLWNDAWTFKDLSSRQTAWKFKAKRFIKFNIVCLIGLGLNVLLLNLFFNILHIHYLAANLLAIAVVTVWNFWINLKLSWRVTDTNE